MFFFIFFILINLQAQNCNDLTKVRALFKSEINEDKLESIISICVNSNCYKTTPYYAVATMQKAEFVWFPLHKFKYFNKGKEILENYIIQNPNNIEARYVRWLTQKKAPSILNYNKNIEEDYQYILTKIAKSDIELNYQFTILSHIKKINNE